MTLLQMRLQRRVQTVRQLREGACEYILRKYNWDDVVRRTLTLYG